MTTQMHWMRGSTKRAGLMTVHRCLLSLMTAAAVIPHLSGIIVATETAENTPARSGPVPFTCIGNLRTMSFHASITWQEVAVDGTDRNFSGVCQVNVAFTSNASEVSLAHADWQPALLVKVYGLQLLPASSKCGYNNLTLFLYNLSQSGPQADLCKMYTVDALYIWASETIRVYLYVWALSDIRASFAVAFVVVRAFDICQITNSSSAILDVEGELYVFAPHSAFVDFIQKRTVCSSSRQLRLAASSPFNALNVTVLAAPTNSSCWRLSLNNRISAAGTHSIVFDAEVTVRYEHNKSTSGCISGELKQEGFTLQFIAVAATTVASTFVVTALPRADIASITAVKSTSTTIPGSTELMGASEAVVIGSAAAGVLAVIGVVLLTALLVIRRRRIQRSHNSSHRATTSVSGLVNADATRTVNHSNRSYATHYLHPHGQHTALFSTSNIASAPIMNDYGADIVMADNDLYGTALDS